MTIAQRWMKDKLQQCLTKQSIIVTIYVRYITAFLNVTNRIDGVMYPSGSTCLSADYCFSGLAA